MIDRKVGKKYQTHHGLQGGFDVHYWRLKSDPHQLPTSMIPATGAVVPEHACYVFASYWRLT
jgi:hypothetical protein